MRQLARLGAVSILVGLIVFAASTVSVGAPNGSMTSELMSVDQLQEVGIRLDPVPDGSRPAAISVEAATNIAVDREDRTDAPAEVFRIMVRQYEESPAQSAYLVLFRSGPELPGGPDGEVHRTAFTGVVIDDQTGEFLRGFYYGGPGL